MANWNKLNKQFDEVLKNFSDKDWENWAVNRIKNKENRRQEMLSKAQLQEQNLTEKDSDFHKEKIGTVI